MVITVSKALSIPIHEQIFLQLKSQILLGEMEPGTRLPSVRQMSNLVKVNRHTISKAYLELEKSKLVQTYASSGTFVRDHVSVSENGDKNYEACKALIAETLEKANECGFSGDEFFSLLYASMLLKETEKPRALFIECNQYALDQYVQDINKEIDIEVDGCLLDDLGSAEGYDIDVQDYDLIMTTLGHYADVRVRLPQVYNIYALNFGPYLSVVNQIRQLQKDTKIAIVCVSPSGAEGLREALIDLGISRNILSAADVNNKRALLDLSAEVDVFVASKYALLQAPEFFDTCGKHIIEYKNVLQRTSIMMINQVIASMKTAAQTANESAYQE
ncbi:MAG TPA: GntR family transcriptional regulator [Clostridiaceae bacterium]|nr:GntR family transcriptional regulator [Clostridiaceae bacterium]